MDGTTGFGTTGLPQGNPYGLPPQAASWMQGLQTLSGALGNINPAVAMSGMRPWPQSYASPGGANNLLATILQMRAAQALGMGAPYQQGVAMPRMSLLSG